MPPDNPRKPSRSRLWDLISPTWKCQTTYFKTGHNVRLRILKPGITESSIRQLHGEYFVAMTIAEI